MLAYTRQPEDPFVASLDRDDLSFGLKVVGVIAECPERLVEGDQKPEERVLHISRALAPQRNGSKTDPNSH